MKANECIAANNRAPEFHVNTIHHILKSATDRAISKRLMPHRYSVSTAGVGSHHCPRIGPTFFLTKQRLPAL